MVVRMFGIAHHSGCMGSHGCWCVMDRQPTVRKGLKGDDFDVDAQMVVGCKVSINRKEREKEK